MEKRLFVIVTIIMLVVSIQCNIFVYRNLNEKNEKIKETKVKTETIIKRKQFEMYYKKDGKYVEYTGTTFPEGYKIDRNMSKCYDADEEELENVDLAIDNNSITVTSKKTAYCRLYLDEIRGGSDILKNLPANSGLSTSKLGDMRRYQGSSVKNYICINDTGAKCTSGSDQMYRIIGIIDSGEEIGQIKVIKETKYGNAYAWNSKYETSQCSGITCSWSNSDLVRTLNSTFLSTLSAKIQNKIVSREWYYGDLYYEYVSIPADKMYQIETGQINTTYVDMSSGSLVSDQKWQKTSTQLKIGLMYLHDYAYAANSHATSCYSNYDTCKSSWIHLSRNGNASDLEWTMSHGGQGSWAAGLSAWVIASNGSIGDYYLHSTYTVRPIFYLSSDVKIKSGGTGEASNPYIIDLS